MMRHEIIRPRSLFDTLVNEDFFSPITYGEGIDIYKVDDTYHVDLNMPGFTKDEISVEFKDDVLSIKAERTSESNQENANYYYQSRNVENVSRNIRFAEVDGEAVDARFENGVLKVTLPKLTKVESVNRIEIK